MRALYWPCSVKLGRRFGSSGSEFAVDDSVRVYDGLKGRWCGSDITCASIHVCSYVGFEVRGV